MLRLLKPANPEDLFVERYDALLGWALSITNHNQAQAEDLVHDAFIQFTHRRGDLAAIENTDAYLNRMLRNMYLSAVRRASLIPDSQLSIADFDSAELGLRTFRASDPNEHLELQDDLRRICQYACTRKETSKAGSVLILRFFHSYYPSEIAQVLRTTRMAVDRWLQISRREAKLYLSDPGALKFMSESPTTKTKSLVYTPSPPELIGALRETIFATRAGVCPTQKELRERYGWKTAIDSSLLSHVVSCPRCLDAINRMLGLPLLAERGSDDRLGRDVPPDKFGGGGTGGPPPSILESKKKYQRREKEVMEHRPQELRISVNGFVLGTQKVNSELSKLALAVNIDEPIGFVEVFSEQDVRLLFFDVDAPTDGNVEQSSGVDFDCGRALDLTLSFRGPWPTLNVSYHDPAFEAVESGVDLTEFEVSVATDLIDTKSRSSQRMWSRSKARLRALSGRLDWRFFLRPGTVTAAFALLLIAVVVFVQLRHTPLVTTSAADLLQRSTDAELALAARTDQVLHRTISLEGRNANGDVVVRQKIEVWRSAEKGIVARRLYDEHGALVAGDWRRSDGVQTLYHHGGKPQLQPVPEKRQPGVITAESVWQLDPSARDFASLIGDPQSAQLQETDSAYVLNYFRPDAGGKPVARATLTLAKSDLHATEMTIRVEEQRSEAGNLDSESANRQSAIGNRQWTEFRLVEISFERRPVNAVAPGVFEPEPELLSFSPKLETPNSKLETTSPSSLALNPSPALATPALEVEVLGLLNNAGAFMGDQLRVTRTPEGKLLVAGLVDSADRKAELLRALASVRSNPAVRIEIETAAEAARRERPKSTGNISVERVEAVEGTSPLYADLKKKFTDDEARRFADRILGRSLQARSHALALKQLAGRFSQTDLQMLSGADRDRWLGLLRGHAAAYEREVAMLERELQSVLPGFSEPGAVGTGFGSDSQLQEAARRLYELSVTCDEALRQSFALSATGNNSARVKTPQFWESLRSAKALANRIQAAR